MYALGSIVHLEWSTTWDRVSVGMYQGVLNATDGSMKVPEVHFAQKTISKSSDAEVPWLLSIIEISLEPPVVFDLAVGECELDCLLKSLQRLPC